MKKLLLGTLILGAACSAKEETPMPETAPMAPSGDVALALKVAGGLEATPAMADSVLSANGLTRAGLDSLLYRIAADSAMSAAYSAGRR